MNWFDKIIKHDINKYEKNNLIIQCFGQSIVDASKEQEIIKKETGITMPFHKVSYLKNTTQEIIDAFLTDINLRLCYLKEMNDKDIPTCDVDMVLMKTIECFPQISNFISTCLWQEIYSDLLAEKDIEEKFNTQKIMKRWINGDKAYSDFLDSYIWSLNLGNIITYKIKDKYYKPHKYSTLGQDLEILFKESDK
jgi:hypothetical protein